MEVEPADDELLFEEEEKSAEIENPHREEEIINLEMPINVPQERNRLSLPNTYVP